MRIVEVEDSSFFAGHLFQKAFGNLPPAEPVNYAAIWMDTADPSVLHVIGFIHLGYSEEPDIREIGFVGGLCVVLLIFRRKVWEKGCCLPWIHSHGKKAFFVYTDNPMLASECGYEALPHPYLMVKWKSPPFFW